MYVVCAHALTPALSEIPPIGRSLCAQMEIAPLVRDGKRVLIVAHRNSLRALIRNLEGLDDDQVITET